MNQLFRNQLEAMDPTNRTELARARCAGLAMESLLGSVNRWAMDNMGPSVFSLGGNGGNVVPVGLQHGQMRTSAPMAQP